MKFVLEITKREMDCLEKFAKDMGLSVEVAARRWLRLGQMVDSVADGRNLYVAERIEQVFANNQHSPSREFTAENT